MKKIISLILSMSMALSLGAGLLSGCQETKRDFKNVILVIGDGMGENHLLNAIDYYDLETPSFMEDQVSWHGAAPNAEQYEIAMKELGA